MTSTNVNCCTDFYRAVSVGSLDNLYEILGKTERKMMSNLAQSYNEMGETPLLVAINKRHLHVVQFLVDILEIDISQVGRFSWKDSNYLNIPPLFAAIISDQISMTNYLIETKKVAVNLDLFMKDSTTTSLDKINVLELIGAGYILHGVCDSHLRGLIYWEKAEIFGQHVIVDGSSISKTFIFLI
jgi:ankyrin repeat protein